MIGEDNMKDEWFADKFCEIAEDLGEIKQELRSSRECMKSHDKRLRKLERQKQKSILKSATIGGGGGLTLGGLVASLLYILTRLGVL